MLPCLVTRLLSLPNKALQLTSAVLSPGRVVSRRAARSVFHRTKVASRAAPDRCYHRDRFGLALAAEGRFVGQPPLHLHWGSVQQRCSGFGVRIALGRGHRESVRPCRLTLLGGACRVFNAAICDVAAARASRSRRPVTRASRFRLAVSPPRKIIAPFHPDRRQPDSMLRSC